MNNMNNASVFQHETQDLMMHSIARLVTYLLIAAFALAALACSSDSDDALSADPTSTSAPPTAEPTVAPEPTMAAPVPPTPAPEPTATAVPQAMSYPDAPELTETGEWVNSEPFTLEDAQSEGKVVLIDFWTYTCINCIRTLPYLREWHDKYADLGLIILGVHTPEFAFEREYENVVEAVGKFELEYPIVQDNEFGTWRAFNNRYWPAKYLIDHEGRIRYTHFGEGAYDETEMNIREILTEAGYDVSDVSASADPGPAMSEEAMTATIEEGQTRELYAGYERNYGALMSQQFPPYVRHVEYYEAPDVKVLYEDPGERVNHFMYLNGLWLNTEESLVHARETMDYEDYIALKFFGASVNVVMSPQVQVEGEEEGVGELGEPYDVRVFLDDGPVPEDQAGKDIEYDSEGNSYVTVDTSRMYFLVNKGEFGGGELRLSSNSAEFTVFAFTFGSYEGGEPGARS